MQKAIALENHYEAYFSSQLNLPDFELDAKKYIDWLRKLEQKKFSDFYTTGEALLNSEPLPELQGFIAIWLIIGSESQYDMEKRNHYLSLLDSIRKSHFSIYIEYYKLYFSSLTYFFDAQLVESESLINKAYQVAVNMKYPRGQARCLYQKAIILFDLKQNVEAQKTIKQCIELCSYQNLNKTKEKALTEFCHQKGVKTGTDTGIENTIHALRTAIAVRDLPQARALLGTAESMRRKQNYSRKKYSLYFYRIQLLFIAQKTPAARHSLAKVDDQILKSRLFDFMQREKIQLTHDEENLNRILKLQLGQSVYNETLNQMQNFEAILVKNIRNSEIQKLVMLLMKSELPLEKEAIFELIYNYRYDPVIHDAKLYKLILRTRKELATDLIINHYGKYSLNLEKYKFVD